MKTVGQILIYYFLFCIFCGIGFAVVVIKAGGIGDGNKYEQHGRTEPGHH